MGVSFLSVRERSLQLGKQHEERACGTGRKRGRGEGGWCIPAALVCKGKTRRGTVALAGVRVSYSKSKRECTGVCCGRGGLGQKLVCGR